MPRSRIAHESPSPDTEHHGQQDKGRRDSRKSPHLLANPMEYREQGGGFVRQHVRAVRAWSRASCWRRSGDGSAVTEQAACARRARCAPLACRGTSASAAPRRALRRLSRRPHRHGTARRPERAAPRRLHRRRGPRRRARSASVGGVSLHANVAVSARDRRRLGACVPLRGSPARRERAALAPGGRNAPLSLEAPLARRHDTRTPRAAGARREARGAGSRRRCFHLACYHGILGPCTSERDRVVPAGAKPSPRLAALTNRCEPGVHPRPRRGLARQSPCITLARTGSGGGDASLGAAVPRSRRLAWADLMQRVFAVDVLECPRCHGRMRLVAAIHPPEATAAIFAYLGLPARAPPTDAARPDSEADTVSWDP